MAPSTSSSNGYGGAFVALLLELGYDGAQLNTEMFDALFGLPSMRIQAFLEWFLASIKPRHSVARQLQNPNDYAIYSALMNDDQGIAGAQQQQRGLLGGKALEAAELACQLDAQQHQGESASLDATRAQNAALEQEIARLEAQLQRLHTKNDKVTKMVQKTTLLADAHVRHHQKNSTEKEHFKCLLTDMQAPCIVDKIAVSKQHAAKELSVQMDNILSYLLTTATSASNSSMDPPSSAPGFSREQQRRNANVQWETFVYQQSLSQLQDAELHNMDAIKAKVASIVTRCKPNSNDPGGSSATTAVVSMASQSSDPMLLLTAGSDQDHVQQLPSWLHDSDPRTLQLREQDAHIYNKCSLELARLEKAYAVGEHDALLARMQLAKHEALWMQIHTHGKHASLYQQYQLMSDDALRSKQQQLVASMAATKHEVTHFVSTVLPKVCDELAFLRSTTILLGSYEHKLWRQENRFLKLRGILETFEHQHGRLKLVHRLLDAEWEDLQEMDAIFSHFYQELERESDRIQARLPRYNHNSLQVSSSLSSTISMPYSSDALVRASLPDTDEIAHALYDYMERQVDTTTRSQQLQQNDENARSSFRHLSSSSFRLRTFDDLAHLCDRKLANDASIAERLEQVDHEWRTMFEKKRTAFVMLRRELFGTEKHARSSDVAPMLLPHQLVAAFQEAKTTKEQTEQDVYAALESLRLKKRELAMDPTRRQQQEEQFARLQRELEQRGRLSGEEMVS
ncbi:hypothetical protein FI667_g16000, partial [Globisporangium splendens]